MILALIGAVTVLLVALAKVSTRRRAARANDGDEMDELVMLDVVSDGELDGDPF